MSARKNENVETMGAEYEYESKRPTGLYDEDSQEGIDLDSLPIIQIEEWLSPDIDPITKWIKLPSRNGKVLIKAMTQKEFKNIRDHAPKVKQTTKNGKIKLVADQDWIEQQIIMEALLEPKLPDAKMLEHGLAGDVSFLTMEITKLSGFDINFQKLVDDALE